MQVESETTEVVDPVEPEGTDTKEAASNSNPAFHLGRWMALAETIHKKAHGGSDTLSGAVGSVCETPCKSLPRVVPKVRNALQKLQRMGENRERTVKLKRAFDFAFYKFSSVWGKDTSYPLHLSDNDQLQFWGGYAYQNYLIGQWNKDKGSDS